MAYHLDFETFSGTPLGSKSKPVSSSKYASDPSTEILLCAVAQDYDEPIIWRCDKPNPDALLLIHEAVESGEPIYAHNVDFEYYIAKHLWESTFKCPKPELKQWRCTQAMCRRAAIPQALEDAGKFLKVEAEKDKRGKALIKRFCETRKPTNKDPRERIRPKDDPEAFEEFVEYCLQDVRTEQAIHRKLQKFELKGQVLDSFHFNLEMCDRGIPVNLKALHNANELIEELSEKLTAEFRAMTAGHTFTMEVTKKVKGVPTTITETVDTGEGLNPTQIQKCKGWFQSQGYLEDDLQAQTIEDFLDDSPEQSGMDPNAIEALKAYQLSGFAALKKIPSMISLAEDDARIRGCLQWSGAIRTHRWAGKYIQPQNFKRPEIDDTQWLYTHLQKGTMTAEGLELLYPNPLLAIASCIRHFIQPPASFNFDLVNNPDAPNHKAGVFLDADYSSIEACINPWLCGAKKKLEMLRNKDPLYERMGAIIFGKTVQEVIDNAKTEMWRFVGKQAELGCGYNMGGVKFQGTCANFGQEVSLQLAERAVFAWRNDPPNAAIVKAWKSIDEAAKRAIRQPEKWVTDAVPTGRIKFTYTDKVGFPALVMKLPSGHCLIYPHARIRKTLKKHKGREYESEEIQFFGPLEGKQGRWGWVGTYGGKLLENATQAVAGDVMTHGALNASRKGFPIFMLVHDQALAEKHTGLTMEGFIDALCDLPDWAEGMPIRAEGGEVPFYLKD